MEKGLSPFTVKHFIQNKPAIHHLQESVTEIMQIILDDLKPWEENLCDYLLLKNSEDSFDSNCLPKLQTGTWKFDLQR